MYIVAVIAWTWTRVNASNILQRLYEATNCGSKSIRETDIRFDSMHRAEFFVIFPSMKLMLCSALVWWCAALRFGARWLKVKVQSWTAGRLRAVRELCRAGVACSWPLLPDALPLTQLAGSGSRSTRLPLPVPYSTATEPHHIHLRCSHLSHRSFPL